jgi:hypothetical protein
MNETPDPVGAGLFGTAGVMPGSQGVSNSIEQFFSV